MSSPFIYTAQQGDTFSTVARLMTGSDTNADAIKAANPGQTEPMADGDRITVPDFGTAGNVRFKDDGIDIRVNSFTVVPYDNFRMTITIDGFRKIGFGQPNEDLTRKILPQLSPVKVDCGIDGERVMTGYLEPVKVQSDRDKKSLDIECASYPNLLDNRAPSSGWPINFRNDDLQIIADRICGLFSLRAAFDVNPGAQFKKPTMKRTDNALDFLVRLAKQRSYIISDSPDGDVVFTAGIADGDPVLEIDDESRPDAAVVVNYSADNYYSSITGVLKSKTERKQKRYTLQNPHYEGIIKDNQVEFADIDEGELERATIGAMGRMFGDAFSVEITVPFWRGNDGQLFRPQTFIKVRSPRNYIKEFTTLVVRKVDLIKETNIKVATLNCVLPGIFSGIIPDSVPWRAV